MYLKSLELHGFKSFPDKISLEFGKGLTAVVGPNGSGKSNIGDAVRWVLGEQSSKTLRGGKMEDVIFGGTEKRKPVSFASVTLNIANDDRTLSVDCDNVSVTRKLYRNGDSEYLINGSQVRLKDVLELFMDTGLGRDGYSIIGQGRVADIVGSKSNERREIFEEAAGISKFRYKKAESERRLASAEDNILRLKDILAELEGRVEPLRVQSEKAKKYLVLANERRSLELSVWTNRLTELKGIISHLDNELLLSNGEYEHLTNEMASAEEEIEQLTLKRRQCTALCDEYRSRISSLNEKNADAASYIAVCKNNIMHYEDEIAEAERKTAELSNDESEVEKKIKSVADDIERIKSEHKKTADEALYLEESLTRMNSEADEYSKGLQASQDKLNKAYIERSELSFSISSAKLSADEAAGALSQAKSLINDIFTQTGSAQSELEEIKKSIAGVDSGIAERTNKLAGYNMLYSRKSEQLKTVSSDFNSCELEIRSLASKRQMLIDLENSMEGFAGSVKSVISAGKSGRLGGIRGTVAQLVSVDSEYSLAIETALGAGLQNIVVDNESSAKSGIKFLKERNGGRATFLPISSIRGSKLYEKGLDMQEGYVALACELVSYDSEYESIIQSMLGRIVIAENIDLAANIAKKYGYKFRIITLDGQVINSGGSFTGGSSSKSGGMLSRKNEIMSVEEEIKRLQAKNQTLGNKLDTLTAETQKLGFDVDGEKEIISQLESDKIRFNGEVKRLELIIGQYDERKSELEAAIEQNNIKAASAERTVHDSEERLSELTADILSLEQKLSDADAKNSEAKERREALSNEMSEKKLRLVELSKDIEAAESSIQRLKDGIESSKSAGREYLLKIQELKGKISAEQENISERVSEQESAKSSIALMNQRIREELDKSLEYEQEENSIRAKNKAKSDRKEAVSAETSRLSERLDTLRRDNDSIISQLWESYSLSIAEAYEAAMPCEDIREANKRLTELKNKIRSLGSVNTDAIDEYEEVSKRYETMSSRLADVLKSKQELEKLISDLTKSMREMFVESFNKINESFKTIFVELFGGGRGELVLTDPENVLESGIEINVAPPGKVIKNLSLLSGGEQSFVAIAIYFAILKLRPSPFCILDEIEAALDDVNVTRYAQYLRNFTDTTQFILITHRRGTMEEADVLYGVTMQEKGVSKLLKMDVSDVSFADEN